MQHLTLRTAKTNDKNFVDALTRLSMQTLVEKVWQTEAEREYYYTLNPFEAEHTKIVQYEGKDIGRISLRDSSEERWIIAIHLMPAYQGKGIGKYLLNKVIEKATEEKKDLFLTVLTVNPAKYLYEKLDFEIYEERDHRYFMKRMHSLSS